VFFGFGVEPYMLEGGLAVVAAEAVGVEAERAGGDDAALDGIAAEVTGGCALSAAGG
jgi:hypothetical protein